MAEQAAQIFLLYLRSYPLYSDVIFFYFEFRHFCTETLHRQCVVEKNRPSTSSCLRRVPWHANVNGIHRGDVESSNPYRLVSVQNIVSLRRLPIKVHKSRGYIISCFITGNISCEERQINISEPTLSRIKQNIRSKSSPMAKKFYEGAFRKIKKSDIIYESVKNGFLFIFQP
jgi:hypothetical protein